jgi:hypothetical protein
MDLGSLLRLGVEPSNALTLPPSRRPDDRLAGDSGPPGEVGRRLPISVARVTCLFQLGHLGGQPLLLLGVPLTLPLRLDGGLKMKGDQLGVLDGLGHGVAT